MDAVLTKRRAVSVNRRFGGVVLFSAIMAFLAQLILSSRFTDLDPSLDVLRLASIGIILLTSLIGVFFCLTPKTIGAGLLSILFMLAVPLWVYLFDQRANQPFELSSGGDYYGFGLVGLFIALTRVEDGVQRFLRGAFRISVLYSLLYMVVAPLLSAGVLHMVDGGQLARAADASSGRGVRAIIATSFISFPLAVAVARLTQGINYRYVLLALICLADLWFAQSRLFTVIVLAVLLPYLLIRQVRLLGTGAFLLFLAMAVLALVVAHSSLNPFVGFEDDQSALARRQGVEIVHRLIGRFWFTGAGMASGTDAYEPLTGVRYFFPSDLGLIGQYFSFGILGLLVYTGQAFGACFSSSSLAQLGVQRRYAVGMGLTGVILVIYSMLSPTFGGGNGTTLGAFFLALLPYSPLVGFWRRRRARSVGA